MPARGRRPTRRCAPSRPHRVLLGVSGGIAAYKSLELVRRFRKLGWEVQVVMTDHARRLVGDRSFASLSGRPVARELFPRRRPRNADEGIAHIEFARWADLVLVAPATANIIGKLASGIADDLLSTVLLAIPAGLRARGRVIVAPAMNTRMWQHPSVRQNLDRLRDHGCVVVGPDPGELACGESGAGRLADVEDIALACRDALADDQAPPDLAGIRALVTAGRTEEPLDPVRVITNRSTGRMGIAIARQLRLCGADTRLVCGAVSEPLPAGLPAVEALTAEAMRAAVVAALPRTDLLVMCAAVADYRPARAARAKSHRDRLTLELERTPDILKEVSRMEHQAVVIGFSHDPLVGAARRKLRAKRLDLVVANPFATAGANTIRPALVAARGPARRLAEMTKTDFARVLTRESARLLAQRRK
jgi:phosphopantothenoylcysteine decarboxylase/phosphopantothenate--cysteine ligase